MGEQGRLESREPVLGFELYPWHRFERWRHARREDQEWRDMELPPDFPAITRRDSSGHGHRCERRHQEPALLCAGDHGRQGGRELAIVFGRSVLVSSPFDFLVHSRNASVFSLMAGVCCTTSFREKPSMGDLTEGETRGASPFHRDERMIDASRRRIE